MSEPTPPSRSAVDPSLARHGHISYLEIPATDIETSAAFYETVFGWEVRRRDDGQHSFDDRSGCLIGRWKTGCLASREPGLLPYIYVDQIDRVIALIEQAGGRIVEPIRAEGNLRIATFRDPAGNLLGIWEA